MSKQITDCEVLRHYDNVYHTSNYYSELHSPPQIPHKQRHAAYGKKDTFAISPLIIIKYMISHLSTPTPQDAIYQLISCRHHGSCRKLYVSLSPSGGRGGTQLAAAFNPKGQFASIYKTKGKRLSKNTLSGDSLSCYPKGQFCPQEAFCNSPAQRSGESRNTFCISFQ